MKNSYLFVMVALSTIKTLLRIKRLENQMSFKGFSNRRTLLKTLTAAGLGGGWPAIAQPTFPNRPIKMVIGLPAGGAADTVVRLVAEELKRGLNESVVIENKPGGLYQIAVQSVLGAPADGHSLLYVNSSFVAVQAIHKRFDLLRDFQPLLQTGETPSVILVRADSPFRTMKDLVDYGLAHPRKLTYGMLGVGSYEHLSGLALEQAAGFKAMAVPYKGGPDMVNAVIAGDISYTSINALTGAQYLSGGRLRALACRSEQRIATLPDIPTLQELGIRLPLPGLWSGYAVHSKTPPAIADRLFRELTAAMHAPLVRKKLEAYGLAIKLSASSDEFRELIRRESATMVELGKGLDISKA